ncbi:MAG: diacylglycerol kinase family protein [Phycisphaerales bacterium]|nr:diacylglycerol kinase family protein [Phycisphaerales bacterium]
MINQVKRFLNGRTKSFGHALRGVEYVVRSQKNAWVHAMATVMVVAAGIWTKLSAGEWCWMIAAIGAVWAAEAMNTALELLCDVAHPAFHPMIGRAKDAAAGAVLIVAVAAAAVGACVMWPHVFVAK